MHAFPPFRPAVLPCPSPAEVNKTVTFTCLVKEFYPAEVSISWLENGTEIKGQNLSRPLELPLGLFELRSRVEVQATEEKNGSTITCTVAHDAQAPLNTLKVDRQGKWNGTDVSEGVAQPGWAMVCRQLGAHSVCYKPSGS
uniref:Ig-like domain-containing protein n=1 Tax=Serinus canaria TaxID=9135 RepID=A0A8C9NJU5_SERCA